MTKLNTLNKNTTKLMKQNREMLDKIYGDRETMQSGMKRYAPRPKPVRILHGTPAYYKTLPECGLCTHRESDRAPCINPALWEHSPGARPGGVCRALKTEL